MTGTEKNAFSERQIVIFKLQNEHYGVDISQVREIIKMENVTRIPNTEECVDGVINLRGKIITVVDLAKKLGLSYQHPSNGRIVVVEIEGSVVGFTADECNEVLRLPEKNVQPPPELVSRKISKEFLEGVGIMDERLIVLLNVSKILQSIDTKKIVEQATAQAAAPAK